MSGSPSHREACRTVRMQNQPPYRLIVMRTRCLCGAQRKTTARFLCTVHDRTGNSFCRTGNFSELTGNFRALNRELLFSSEERRSARLAVPWRRLTPKLGESDSSSDFTGPVRHDQACPGHPRRAPGKERRKRSGWVLRKQPCEALPLLQLNRVGGRDKPGQARP
jgi:hypothetical protein